MWDSPHRLYSLINIIWVLRQCEVVVAFFVLTPRKRWIVTESSRQRREAREALIIGWCPYRADMESCILCPCIFLCLTSILCSLFHIIITDQQNQHSNRMINIVVHQKKKKIPARREVLWVVWPCAVIWWSKDTLLAVFLTTLKCL